MKKKTFAKNRFHMITIVHRELQYQPEDRIIRHQNAQNTLS